jgi:hypothetical protein
MARSARNQNEQKEARMRAQREFLARTLSDPVGRDFFYNFIFLFCGIHQSYLSGDLVQMAHQEGIRYVGASLADQFREASPDLFLQMLKEATHGRQSLTRTDTWSVGNGHDTAASDTDDGADASANC